MNINIYFDGGCKPNPGRGYGSYQVISEKLNHLALRQDFGPKLTNNMAEYLALIAALKWLRHFTDKTETLIIYTDSTLLMHQLRGRYRVKVVHIKELWQECIQLLLPYHRYEIRWHDRKNNVNRFGH